MWSSAFAVSPTRRLYSGHAYSLIAACTLLEGWKVSKVKLQVKENFVHLKKADFSSEGTVESCICAKDLCVRRGSVFPYFQAEGHFLFGPPFTEQLSLVIECELRTLVIIWKFYKYNVNFFSIADFNF